MNLYTTDDPIKPIQILKEYLVKVAKVPSDDTLLLAVEKALETQETEDIDDVWYNLYEDDDDIGEDFDLWVMEKYGQ